MTSAQTLIRSPQRLPEIANVLRVERTDITFSNSRPNWVDIRITVTNAGDEYSKPTRAALSAAPLGAFVPWHPLAMMPVPGLAPGESFVVRAEAHRPQRQSLGPPDRVPPRRLLTAMGMGDDRPKSQRPQAGMLETLATILRGPRRPASRGKSEALVSGALPADPFELLSRANPHWAGNLNIFVGGRAVERHMAQSLRVYPGRTNMAFFIVGSGRDAYSFHLKADAAAWEATIFDLTGARSLVPDVNRTPAVPLAKWVELGGHSMMILTLYPPANCSRGAVEVHVTQRSTGETAIVEFSLDPSAAGPGCYTV
jgi:hypothetical protein